MIGDLFFGTIFLLGAARAVYALRSNFKIKTYFIVWGIVLNLTGLFINILDFWVHFFNFSRDVRIISDKVMLYALPIIAVFSIYFLFKYVKEGQRLESVDPEQEHRSS